MTNYSMNGQEIKQTLLIGIGNSAREDDGLGWAFVERVEQEGLFSGDLLYRFQLNLEDAELVTKYSQVVFVDAHKGELQHGYSLSRCIPDAGAGFSTHQLKPESVLYLCQQLYDVLPQAFVLGIQGYRWELQEGLSAKAKENLELALAWFAKQKQKYPFMPSSS
ncbi:MAG: hydrogenase maturation protease [Pontibacter sp.]|nr:hydrogenase maturation protease [Pontibacter sp.]